MDIVLTQWINGFVGSNAALDSAMIGVSKYGVPLMIALVITQWWFGKPKQTARHACVSTGASFALGLGLAQIMLLFIHRDRPYDAGISRLIIDKTVDWSFPSDHAIASTSIVFAWALNGMRRWLWVFSGLAVLICISRVYVGMHYASDIAGGMGVALVAVWVVKLVYRPDSKFDHWVTSLL